MKGRLSRCILLMLCFFPLVVEAQVPVPNFTSDVTSGCTPVVVSFTDISTNNPTSWRWDLGNGVISTLRDPQTSYFNPGTYTITLTATNASGSRTITKTAYLQIHALPDANYTSKDTFGCTPLTATFADLSRPNSGTITGWEWNFGDGGTSASANPTHTFTKPGAYTVSLKVTNNFGCIKNNVKPLYVKAGNPVTADFIADVKSSCTVPATVDFINSSVTSGNMSYGWNFDDGTISGLKNPSHTYTRYGNFAVTLYSTSDGGCRDSITKVVTIQKRVVTISGPDSLCVAANGSFSANYQQQPTGIQWLMGDGTTYNTASINHTYSASGNYTIRLITELNNCYDTVTKLVKVNAVPVVGFNSLNTSGCQVPHTVNFQNTSTGANSWLWDFGDGTSSTAQSPTKTYTALGNYTVTLTATTNRGCISTSAKNDFVVIQPANVTLTNLPAAGCLPFIFSPTINTGGATITAYRWNFGDGTTSTLPNPNHTYTRSGNYTVKLLYTTAAGCTDSVMMDNALILGERVNVDFTANPLKACGKETIVFTPNIPFPLKNYEWNFGDSSLSQDAKALHKYRDTGYFSVKLSVDSNGCRSSIIKDSLIYVGGTLARFSFEKDCTNRGMVSFKNRSISGVNYTWFFGDGDTSTKANPTHIYTTEGDHTVTLISENNGCLDSIAYRVPVWFGGIDVRVANDTICKRDAANFTLQHKRPEFISNILWDYGDGTNSQSTSNPVTQFYYKHGTFNLTAITIDTYGCSDTIVKPDFVRVNGPLAMFDASVIKGCRNTEIYFADSSKNDGLNGIAKWNWNFGDGTSKEFNSAPFSHNYANEGTFDVTLKVTDSSGCTSEFSKSQFVLISEGNADFLSVDSMTCTGKNVAFRDFSSGNIVNHLWQFGDGQTSALVNPTHTYNDTGLYTVKLYVTSSSGCVDSLIKRNYVTVKNPVAKFGTSDISTSCAPLQVNFYDSSYYAKSWLWEFSDGKTSDFINPSYAFFTPGTQSVKLIVTSEGGCTAQTSFDLKVTGPVGTLSYTPLLACENNSIVQYKAQAVGTSEFKWDFNDGTIVNSTNSVITHIYQARGKFLPKVIFTDSSGCTLPIEGNDTIYIEGATAKFGFDDSTICENGVVIFTDSSTANSSISYLWNFGDGTTSTAKNPLPHRYANAGNYTVQLITSTQNNCRDTATFNNLSVVKYPVVNIVGVAEACQQSVLNFSAQVASDTSNIVSWQWQFGNGDSSNLQKPPAQLFNKPGLIVNSVIVVNSTGCSREVFDTVMIHPIPQITTADTTICLGDSIQLQATGAPNFNWSSAAALSCTSCPSPVVSPKTDQYFIVNATSTLRCANEDSVLVKVLHPFNISTSFTADSICVGKSTQLGANGADSYLWTPSTGLNLNNIANPVASPSATVLYTVVGYDSLGCFRDTATSLVVVYPYPTVNAGPDITLSAGNAQAILPAYSGTISEYLWSPSKDLSCTTCPNPVVTARDNISYRIMVQNEAGCQAQDSLNIIVTCDNSVIFIPNTFSPNGDGMNDIFYARGKAINSIRSIQIFNRWGEPVFTRKNFTPNDPSNGWNGTYKNTKAPMGVYTYAIEVICQNSQILKFTGNLTLIQ